MLLLGDCLERLKEIPDNHIDAVVTDPPYGLSFMGKKWDYEVPSVEIWREVFRVLKPGGHLLSFAGTRTYHRMAVNIEDAGFEVRDMVSWIYGQGFPKSLDISKALDKSAGAVREIVAVDETKLRPNRDKYLLAGQAGGGGKLKADNGATVTAPATALAKQWQGWGTALKPALEPVCLARKPLIGTVVENVKEHGTGGLNIDASRINPGEHVPGGGKSKRGNGYNYGAGEAPANAQAHEQGRWPSNVILDEEAGRVLDEQSGTLKARGNRSAKQYVGDYEASSYKFGNIESGFSGDSGGASRFFYCAKVSSKERNAGLEGMPERQVNRMQTGSGEVSANMERFSTSQKNHHPTVKPVKLMEYLCKLVTPPGGIVLDPFMGSGSTGIAAMSLGFRFIGIEREEEYLKIAEARISSKVDIKRCVKTNLVRK